MKLKPFISARTLIRPTFKAPLPIRPLTTVRKPDVLMRIPRFSTQSLISQEQMLPIITPLINSQDREYSLKAIFFGLVAAMGFSASQVVYAETSPANKNLKKEFSRLFPDET